MNSKLPNAVCVSGIVLTGWALWAIHPSLCAGAGGVALTLFGAYLNRRPAGKKGQS